MCLAIPARLVEYADAERQFGKVELGGVIRRVNTSLLIGDDACEVGDFVLVHVGFALSRVSEEEAAETLRLLEEMGPAYTDELEMIREWQATERELLGDAMSAPSGVGTPAR
jgi:hydrogenase expression/formation protein HypC